MTMVSYSLLVIARTQSLAKRLASALDANQYVIRWAPSTTQAMQLDLCPSLVILELPPSGGARSVSWLKKQFGKPLLVLPRVGQLVPDEANGSLDPNYTVGQLAELIRTTLMNAAPHVVQAGGMSLDTRTRQLHSDGEWHRLRPIGCRILALLMAKRGRVVGREELFQRAWHTEDGDHTRALDVHIAYLRRLLEADPGNPTLIVTEWGVGYRLQPPD